MLIWIVITFISLLALITLITRFFMRDRHKRKRVTKLLQKSLVNTTSTPLEVKRIDKVQFNLLIKDLEQLKIHLQSDKIKAETILLLVSRFLEAVPVGVNVLDAKSGTSYYANNRAQQILGECVLSAIDDLKQLSEVYQLYQAHTQQLYPVEQLPGVRALQGESVSIDDIEVHIDDKIIPLEIWGTPIFDEHNNIIYAITAFQDITERKQAEAQREQFTRELKTLNASLEEKTRELQALNASLEDKVAERTAQLQQKNQQLEQKNELIRQVFGRYLSDEIVDALLETESGLALGGERREITILTSDIRGFTAQANQLLPEQVVKIINFYLAIMADVIGNYQGTIDEFMGDGILVLFGAPIVRADDPERAVACAVAMQLAMTKVNEQMTAWGFAPLEMGIGVNTGEVVAGNIGGEKRAKYGVIGNEVNLTYRLESNTIGGQIFISASTLQKVSDLVKIHAEKQVKFKGIKQPITIYEVEGIGGKYNLYLDKEEEEVFLPLRDEIPLQYTVLEGKQVGAQAFSGYLFKVSGKGAFIRCEVENELLPEPFFNLKINLVLSNSSATNEELYAKVLSCEVEENSLYVRFTSGIPTNVKAQLAALCKLEWTSDLSVNHSTIDDKNQQLLKKFNELISSISCCQEEGVAKILSCLETDVITHFEAEEQLMKQCDYPHYAAHKAQHAKFIETLNDFKRESDKRGYQQAGNLYLALKIQQKVIEWLNHHIGQSDKRSAID
jgi:hemerythrin-like metal-binding protein